MKSNKQTIIPEPDGEWISTERSDKAEEAIEREYHYHMLRASELKIFLNNCGVDVDNTL